MTWFIERFHVDMRHYFPSLDGDLPHADAAYAVFCGNEIAGILLGTLEEDGALRIAADYTTPKFRDSSVGTYLYQQLPYEGLSRLIFTGEQPEHVAYISRMGFELQPDGSYVKQLA